MIKEISSIQNPEIKNLIQLQEKARTRRKEKHFPVEGIRETSLALKGGFKLKKLFFCRNLFPHEKLSAFTAGANPEIIEISTAVYRKLSYRSSTEGLLSLFEIRENTLTSLNFKSKNPLILVAEAPEKPGNIGALLRTADAAALDAVIIANPKTDLYNPNIIRSSVGGLFTVPVATGSSKEIISFLQEKNIAIYAAALQASTAYEKIDFTGPAAIVVGTEAEGLSEKWLKESSQNIIIPMHGKIDSMNVSVAAGILIFEAKRQRNSMH